MKGKKKVDIFFPMFIGDYMADTGHLTTRQHGAYHLLMYHYWRTRKPLSTDVERLLNICSLSADEWKVDGPVLLEFFERRKEGYFHPRIEEELAKALARKDQKINAGKASAEKRRLNKESTDVATDVQTDAPTDVVTDDSTKRQRNVNSSPSPSPSLSLKQRTPLIAPPSTQTSKTEKSGVKNKTSPEEEFILPEDIPEVPWNEWMKSRKKKKAVDSPYAKNLLIKNLREISTKTKISITDLIHEAIARDWKGIKEEWVVKTQGGSYVATTAGNISIPKTFREIDDERERKARRQFLLLGEKQDDQDPDHPSILDLGEEDPF